MDFHKAAESEEGPKDHEPLPERSFIESLDLSLSHYAKEFPELTTDSIIQFDNLGPIANAAVFFALDLKLLTRSDKDLLERLKSENDPLWSDIDQLLDRHARNFSKIIGTYLRWSFVRVEEKIWEVGERPPVGRYTPGARRGGLRGSMSSGPRRSGPGQRPDRDRDRGPRRDGGKGPPRERDGGPQGGREGGGHREKGRERGDRDRSRSRSPREPRRDGSHADQEQAALEIVKSALDQLKNDPALKEIKLDPSNSFFRRLQHKKAVSDGFYSYSTGEGSERSVVISKEKPANEDAE